MSLKNRFLSISAAAIGVGLLSTFTFAQENKAAAPQEGVQKHEKRAGKHGGRGMHGGKRGMHRGFHALHGLDLTDTQKEQIKQIHESNKLDEATRQELRAIRDARRSGTAITAEQEARVKAIREQMMTRRAGAHEQILAILTPEQKAKLEAKKAEMKLRREQFQQKRQEWRKNHPANTPAVAPKVS